jgi:hypothetical protein
MMLNTVDPIHPMVGFLGLQVHEGVQGTRKNLLAWLVEKKKNSNVRGTGRPRSETGATKQTPNKPSPAILVAQG